MSDYEVIVAVGTTVTKVVSAENQAMAIENVLAKVYSEYEKSIDDLVMDVIDAYELDD